MLKLATLSLIFLFKGPAAFRRLCVETLAKRAYLELCGPAAFRRLCVETDQATKRGVKCGPAAFRRLCVETPNDLAALAKSGASRLQAAVC